MDKARDLFTIKLVSKSLTTLCYYYCKLSGLVKKICVIKSVDEICRSIFIIDRDTRKREYSYSSTSSQWRKEKQKKKKKKKTNLREHHDRIGSKGWREQQSTYPLSIIVQRVPESAIQSISFITKILGRRLSSNRGQRDEQEMIPHRHPPRARIPTPVREANVLSGEEGEEGPRSATSAFRARPKDFEEARVSRKRRASARLARQPFSNAVLSA